MCVSWLLFFCCIQFELLEIPFDSVASWSSLFVIQDSATAVPPVFFSLSLSRFYFILVSYCVWLVCVVSCHYHQFLCKYNICYLCMTLCQLTDCLVFKNINAASTYFFGFHFCFFFFFFTSARHIYIWIWLIFVVQCTRPRLLLHT